MQEILAFQCIIQDLIATTCMLDWTFVGHKKNLKVKTSDMLQKVSIDAWYNLKHVIEYILKA